MSAAPCLADDASTCILIGTFGSKYLSTIACHISSLILLNAICSCSVQMNRVFVNRRSQSGLVSIASCDKNLLSYLLATGSLLVVFRLLVASSGRSPPSLRLVSLHPSL